MPLSPMDGESGELLVFRTEVSQASDIRADRVED